MVVSFMKCSFVNEQQVGFLPNSLQNKFL